MAEDNGDGVVVIEYAGETFELGEPSADIVLRFVNTFAAIGRRAQGHVQKVMRKPTMAGLLWSLGEVLTVPDLERLGSAALQFPNDRAGRKWIKEHGVKIAPILRATIATIKQSTDLVEALQALGEGFSALEGATQSEELAGLVDALTGTEGEETEPEE